MGVHVGGLDMVPLLAAIAGCHCWAAIAGLPLLGIGGVGVHVGGLDVVPLLAATGGCHCWAAIAGDRGGWLHTLADWTWCHLGAIAGDRGGVGVHVGGLDVALLLAAIAGCHCWAAIARCHCWAPLLGCHWCTRWRIGRGAVAACHCWMPWWAHCWMNMKTKE